MRRPNGSGTIEHRSRGWLPRLPSPSRAALEYCSTYDDAEALLNASLEHLKTGNVISSKTLLAYGRGVLDQRERDGYRGVDRERSRWETYVGEWSCALRPVATIRRREIREWILSLRERLAHQTCVNALNLMRAVFRQAVEDDIVESNPVRDIELRKHGRTDDTSTWLTLDELGSLLNAASLEGRVIIAVAAGCGLRQGEQRSLRTCDVFLDGKEPHFLIRHGAPGKPTKNGKPKRVPLFGLALAAMRVWAPYASDKGLVFSTKGGYVRTQGHMVEPEEWRQWLAAAGIKRRVRWHDLRHTCATLLLRGDLSPQPWPLEAVCDLLGHSSLAVTERYARLIGSSAERAARQLPQLTTKMSRLRDLNSRPTVYETPDEVNDSEVLAALVGILRRAAKTGDVRREVVDAIGDILDETPNPKETGVSLPRS